MDPKEEREKALEKSRELEKEHVPSDDEIEEEERDFEDEERKLRKITEPDSREEE
ncbi:MAG: hypothetical protein ABIC95_04915 [archaeon]